MASSSSSSAALCGGNGNGRLRILAVFMTMMIFGMCNGQMVCNVPISGLMACRPAVTPPRPSWPTIGCCSALTRANVPCLCSYRQVLPSLGINFDLVMQLPRKCRLPGNPHC